jgi:hypothetical protein
MNHLLSFLSILMGISLGIWLGHLVDPCWIRPVTRAFWRLLHSKGCPLPLSPHRRELLYRGPVFAADPLGLGIEIFDIRACCVRCGRLHRVEMRILSPISPHQ